MKHTFDAALQVTATEQQQTQEMQRFGLAGVATQDFVVSGFGFDKPARTVSDHRLAEHISDGMSFSQLRSPPPRFHQSDTKPPPLSILDAIRRLSPRSPRHRPIAWRWIAHRCELESSGDSVKLAQVLATTLP